MSTATLLRYHVNGNTKPSMAHLPELVQKVMAPYPEGPMKMVGERMLEGIANVTTKDGLEVELGLFNRIMGEVDGHNDLTLESVNLDVFAYEGEEYETHMNLRAWKVVGYSEPETGVNVDDVAASVADAIAEFGLSDTAKVAAFVKRIVGDNEEPDSLWAFSLADNPDVGARKTHTKSDDSFHSQLEIVTLGKGARSLAERLSTVKVNNYAAALRAHNEIDADADVDADVDDITDALD